MKTEVVVPYVWGGKKGCGYGRCGTEMVKKQWQEMVEYLCRDEHLFEVLKQLGVAPGLWREGTKGC